MTAIAPGPARKKSDSESFPWDFNISRDSLVLIKAENDNSYQFMNHKKAKNSRMIL